MVCCGGSSVSPKDEKIAYDPNFKGPLAKRSCKDVIWLLLFVVFWIGMAVIAITAFRDGDINRIIHGYDSYGNTCGSTNSKIIDNVNSGLDMTGRGKLYYINPSNSHALRLCVPSCPSGVGDTDAEKEAAGLCLNSNEGSPYTADATENRGTGTSDTEYNIENTGCPDVVVNASSVINRCVPSIDTFGWTSKMTDVINAEGVITDVVADLDKSWDDIAYLCLFAMVLSLLMVILLRFFAYIFIWVTYILCFIVTVALMVYLWLEYKRKKENYDDTPENERLNADKDEVDTYFGLAVAWSVIGGIILLILIVMRKRIKLVVALFKEAGRAIRKMPLILLVPIWTFAFVLATSLYFVIVYAMLYTVGTAKEVNNRVDFSKEKDLVYMQWYHIFGYLWTTQFLLACQECLIAGGIATFFFTRDKGNISWPLLGSLKRIVRYHIGSLAFGAFIIALVKFIRLLLAKVQKQLKGSGGPIVSFFLKCLQCCLWCFEKCLKFLNRHAYIEIAIYGHSFCTAARKAFSLLIRNSLRVIALNTVGDFVLFIAKIVIVAGCAAAAIFWVQEKEPDLKYSAIPVIFVIVFAWIIAGVFMSVYEMTIDTLFVCFCEDSERNDGSPDRPYFMSDNLLKFMKKANQKAQKKTVEAAKAKPKEETQVEEVEV